ncbi:MAG: signal recognition particle-docking protein FtsY, partial [Propionibacteriaceae bacterium]|nr:signal recognition particle-docking protein FtsY [Propionibacteriaceae bacterium]
MTGLYWAIVWIVGGGIVAAIIVATLVITVGNRKAKLGRAAEPPQAPPAPEQPQLAAPEPSDGQAAASTPAEPSSLDVPEAPASRLTRLRRKLAASDNAFARGLLSLLSADKLSEETW